ncbi:hypothetical protein MASR2M15_28270 [Anaerolineales bacterium]
MRERGARADTQVRPYEGHCVREEGRADTQVLPLRRTLWERGRWADTQVRPYEGAAGGEGNEEGWVRV